MFISRSFCIKLQDIFLTITPGSHLVGGGQFIRRILVKGFIKQAGANIDINRNAELSPDFVIGNNSGVGANSSVGKGTVIGDNVMMGPECLIFTSSL